MLRISNQTEDENEGRIVFQTELDKKKDYLEVDKDYYNNYYCVYDYVVENDNLYNEAVIHSDCVASNGRITGE
jgi:hypothetical protein